MSSAVNRNVVLREPLQSKASLSQQILMARIWLPMLILAVVLAYELYIIPLGGEMWNWWAHVLFYGILGPAATFVTLTWIAGEVRRRERAQADLEHLYGELQASHDLLATIQEVTEQFASATDLDSVLQAASRGIAEATGAVGAAIIIGEHDLSVTRSYGLPEALEADAIARNDALLATMGRASQHDSQDNDYHDRNHHRHVNQDNINQGNTSQRNINQGNTSQRNINQRNINQRNINQGNDNSGEHSVMSTLLAWSGKLEGSVHAYYDDEPSAEQRESFAILTSEFSAVTEAARSRTRDLLTLFDVDRSIRAEGNLERLLSTLLDQTVLRAGATLGGVYLADDEDQLLRLRSYHGLQAAAHNHAVRLADQGCISRTARCGEAYIAESLDDASRQGPLLEQAGSALCLPLVSEDELLGIVVLAHPTPRHFDAANLTFLSLLANQVTLAVRNARAYLQSEELAISEERARIAREIHDGVAQSLASSALKLDLVARLINTPDKALMQLEQAKTTIRESIREVRRSIFALRPIDLERHGFVETIRRYSHDFGQQNDITVSITVGDIPQLTVKSEAVLFRIFQEAMNNVAKHAKAQRVDVRLGTDDAQRAFVEICDDGIGFDAANVSDRVTSAGGLGLKQMRERIEGRDGVFAIHTSCLHPALRPADIPKDKQGTRVYAALPE